MFLKRLFQSISVLSILCLGCTPTLSPQAALESEVHDAVHDFYRAVENQDVRTVYAYLPEDLKQDLSFDAFQAYFKTHEDRFKQFAMALRDEAAARPITISAHPQNDPCAHLGLITDHDGQWKVAQVPKQDAAASIEQRKAGLIQALRSPIFQTVIDDYAQRHPEIDRTQIRQLKRILAFENIPVQNVNFVAKEAIIDVGNHKQIRMSCEPNGWRLISCSL